MGRDLESWKIIFDFMFANYNDANLVFIIMWRNLAARVLSIVYISPITSIEISNTIKFPSKRVFKIFLLFSAKKKEFGRSGVPFVS